MSLLPIWIACALVALVGAGALSFALRLRARHRRFLDAPPPPAAGDAERILDQPQALYHGTRFADGAALLAPAWKAPCVCDVWCTDAALFIRREGREAVLSIAHAEVAEAALHRAYAPIAEKELPMMRLRWRRGGEMMETQLSLRGGMASLEALRREIHLRQENVAEQLAGMDPRGATPSVLQHPHPPGSAPMDMGPSMGDSGFNDYGTGIFCENENVALNRLTDDMTGWLEYLPNDVFGFMPTGDPIH